MCIRSVSPEPLLKHTQSTKVEEDLGKTLDLMSHFLLDMSTWVFKGVFSEYAFTGFPQKFKNTIPCFSIIFHDQQCNFHEYLMHSLQPPLLATFSLCRAFMWNAETVMYLNKHACRPCMHFEIIET